MINNTTQRRSQKSTPLTPVDLKNIWRVLHVMLKNINILILLTVGSLPNYKPLTI